MTAMRQSVNDFPVVLQRSVAELLKHEAAIPAAGGTGGE